MTSWLAVGLGGFAGAITRWQLSSLLQKGAVALPIPIGVLGVNLIGCALMGVVMGVSAAKGWLASPIHLLLATGFLGAFTTYSAFGWEGFSLLKEGKIGASLLYAGLHLILGWGAVAAGWWLTAPRP